MRESTIPWKQIIEFHREIAIRSEESFFSFDMDDQGSERFSYMRNEAVQKMQVDLNVISFRSQQPQLAKIILSD